jgi:uncharacterized protein (TIGR02466 family)|tara:strand:+ start:85 stop:678 length:594 start_codon:yes stop_codon:yes gene_type:complete
MGFIDLFPTSIYNENIQEDSIPSYIEFIKTQSFTGNTVSGYFTENQHILDESIFNSLKQIILKKSLLYLKEIGHKTDSISICNSWANLIQKDQIIPMHDHANSYLSGVFYLTKGSNIIFENHLLKKFLFLLEYFEDINNFRTCKKFPIIPTPGLLLIFPSWLQHKVITSKENIDRLSIAFNIIPKGKFGVRTSILNL